jgi:hypothetical protein
MGNALIQPRPLFRSLPARRATRKGGANRIKIFCFFFSKKKALAFLH